MMNAQPPQVSGLATASNAPRGPGDAGADDTLLARLGALRGGGVLFSTGNGGHGTLRFPTEAVRAVQGLAAAGEPLLYRGYLREGGLTTPIVADVHVLEIRRTFTGAEVDVAFGTSAHQVPASFRFVG
jgi:hypothetical protein